MSRNRSLALLAAIVAFAGMLRFRAMADLHLCLWDDAVLTLEARGIAAGAEEAGRSIERKREEKRTGQDVWKLKNEVTSIRTAEDQSGIPLRFARPFHETLLAVTLAAFRARDGDWPDWAAAWLSAIAGTLSVYLIYLLGARLYSRRAGELAAVFLAASGYHVMYSREGFTEAILVLLQILALLAYVRMRRKPQRRPYAGQLLLGLVCGLGLTAHLRFILVPGILTLYEGLHWLRMRRYDVGVEARRLAAFWAATLFLPLVCEVPYYVLYLVANRLGVRIHVMTYLEQVALVFRSTGLGYAGSLVRFHPQNLLTYPYALLQFEGFAKAALVAAGIVIAVRKRMLGDGLCLAFLVLVPLYYSATVPLLRYGSLAIPLGSLLAARALDDARLEGRREKARHGEIWSIATLCSVLLVFAEETVRALTVVETDSGYATAVETIRGAPHIATMLPVSKAYAGPARVQPVPGTAEELRRLAADGYRTLLVDNLKSYLSYQGLGFPKQAILLGRVEAACTPIRRVPNPVGASLQFGLELNYRPFFETLALAREGPERAADEIAIYDVDECLLKLSAGP